MNRIEEVLLSAISCWIHGKSLSPEPDLSTEQWIEVLRLAKEQEMLPLVLDTVYSLPSFNALDSEVKSIERDSAVQIAIRQIVQTNEFLTLLLRAQEQGLDPVVIKGVVCRSLYPKPMLRPSVDEDILVPPSQTEALHRFLLEQGLHADEPDADIKSAVELSYHRDNSPTYIELHTKPFPPDNDAYGDLNRLFEGIFDRTVRVQIEDVSVRTLSPTDHLLYLLCHAYKHFLHSGMGLRQVCDIGMMARRYNDAIDWKTVYKKCGEIRIRLFAAAVFKIGEKHLGLPMPDAFSNVETDEDHLLEDILTGGNFGLSDADRVHSAAITLDAVVSRRRGKKGGGVLPALFPKRNSLEGRYPYLRKKPWLLPLAWGQRFAGYMLRRKDGTKGTPGRSMRIGRERVDLLREYGIID